MKAEALRHQPLSPAREEEKGYCIDRPSGWAAAEGPEVQLVAVASLPQVSSTDEPPTAYCVPPESSSFMMRIPAQHSLIMSLEEMERQLFDPSLVSGYVATAASDVERRQMRQLPAGMRTFWRSGPPADPDPMRQADAVVTETKQAGNLRSARPATTTTELAYPEQWEAATKEECDELVGVGDDQPKREARSGSPSHHQNSSRRSRREKSHKRRKKHRKSRLDKLLRASRQQKRSRKEDRRANESTRRSELADEDASSGNSTSESSLESRDRKRRRKERKSRRRDREDCDSHAA